METDAAWEPSVMVNQLALSRNPCVSSTEKRLVCSHWSLQVNSCLQWRVQASLMTWDVALQGTYVALPTTHRSCRLYREDPVWRSHPGTGRTAAEAAKQGLRAQMVSFDCCLQFSLWPLSCFCRLAVLPNPDKNHDQRKKKHNTETLCSAPAWKPSFP